MSAQADSQPPLGLIAGEGVFPFLVARGARAAGRRVVCCGFDGIVEPNLAAEVDAFRSVSLLRIGSWGRFLRRHGCREAIMVGRIRKQNLYVRNEALWLLRQLPDFTTFQFWLRMLRKDRRSDAVLGALAQLLSERGIELIDSTTYCQDQLAGEGVLGSVPPSERQLADIERGWAVCGYMTHEDVGQSVAVKDRDVLAVEAVEGTNQMIQRAGELCRGGGWTLVKRANAREDMRLDVPSIGVHTIDKLVANRATCLCVEAQKVILLEKDKVLEAANRAGIAVVGKR